MSILVPPKDTFFDNNGKPLAGGLIFTYVPGSTTPSPTYQDLAQTILNQNPIILDAAGRASIYATGSFRFVVQDANLNTIYDQITTSYLDSTSISAAMLPVTEAPTLAVARTRMGIDDAIATAIAAVNLLPGPTGPIGPTGPTGEAGPAGGPGSSSSGLDYQAFISSGMWMKPAVGSIAIIQMWGAGAGGSDIFNDGSAGPGGYVCVIVPLSQIDSCAVTIGRGGAFVSGSSGLPGEDTTFGGYLTMRGGATGYQNFNQDAGIPIPGPSGYLSSVIGVGIMMGSTDSTSFGIDMFGNKWGGSPFGGTPGGSLGQPVPWPSTAGGTGGTFPGGNGASPGGGGANSGGNGGSGKVTVSCY